MPELPEVETVCAGLAPVMEGRTFTSVTLNRPNLRFAFADNFAERLTGTKINRLSRRAKFLRAELSSGETLIMHLGMSGRFTIKAGPQSMALSQTNPKHDHVIFTMSGENTPKIIYNDPRRFGFMELLGKGDPDRCAHLGPEPLSNQFHSGVLALALKGRKTPIKSALLDQSIVAGLGNIYVCEALHSAHILPDRLAKSLSIDEIEQLCAAIKDTLKRAIAAGGSSLRDFAGADGQLGYFQHSFLVYGRAGEPCPDKACSGSVEKITQSGRTSFFCPICQD